MLLQRKSGGGGRRLSGGFPLEEHTSGSATEREAGTTNVAPAVVSVLLPYCYFLVSCASRTAMAVTFTISATSFPGMTR